jgi:hypothetical protein
MGFKLALRIATPFSAANLTSELETDPFDT